MCWQPEFRAGKSGRCQCGYTLVELSLVVLFLGIMAVAVLPALMSADSGKLQVAAEEVANAMRFARSEAMRLRQPTGFHFSLGSQQIRVFRANTSAVPWVAVHDIYHPVSKKQYIIELDDHLFAVADSISATREYRGICNTGPKIYFDANGIARCLDPNNILLDQYEITLKTGDHTRVVSLDAITGQVAIQ